MGDDVILYTDDGQLDTVWIYVRDRLEERLRAIDDVSRVDVRRTPLCQTDLDDVRGIALFGGDLDADTIARAPELRVVGGVFDALGIPAAPALWARNIPLIDATRAWAPSVAECGLALILCALRRIPYWHMRLAQGDDTWVTPAGQMADDDRFVSGDLGTKRVGVVGMGAIGARVAAWCAEIGADVRAHDPYASPDRFSGLSEGSVDLDELVGWAEVLVVAVPPTPSAVGMLNGARIANLRTGSIVVTITRAAVVDSGALRRRVVADELVWASDVFDREPLPLGDPLLGRPNVVHLPHIAGRTMDANLRVADLVAEDFAAVLGGRRPQAALTPAAVELRGGGLPKPPI